MVTVRVSNWPGGGKVMHRTERERTSLGIVILSSVSIQQPTLVFVVSMVVSTESKPLVPDPSASAETNLNHLRSDATCFFPKALEDVDENYKTPVVVRCVDERALDRPGTSDLGWSNQAVLVAESLRCSPRSPFPVRRSRCSIARSLASSRRVGRRRPWPRRGVR